MKKTPRFPIAVPRYIERICYATFNYRAGYSAENHIYAKETVIAAFREYTLPSSQSHCDHHSELGRLYQAGKSSPSNVMFKGKEEVCEVMPHSEAAGLVAASPKLHGFVGVLKQQRKRAGGIIKHNTNAVKNLAAAQAFPDDNIDEGSSREPPCKKAKQPAKPAAGVPARCRGGDGARAGGCAFGLRAGRHAAVAAVAAAATREQQARRRGGPSGRNRM
eukprot:jgi/Tetstr1/425067/TSEL_015531.t1